MEFDGNFDPSHIGGGKEYAGPGAGATLPTIDVEDDGMGGRLAGGPGGGGIISPYPFAAPPSSSLAGSTPPLSSSAIVGSGVAGIGAGAAAGALYTNEKYHHPQTSPVHSSFSDAQYAPSQTTASSYYPTVAPYAPPFRGPSPGPSVVSPTSPQHTYSTSLSGSVSDRDRYGQVGTALLAGTAGSVAGSGTGSHSVSGHGGVGGKGAELNAPHVMNPDTEYPPLNTTGPQAGVAPGGPTHLAYLQYGPGHYATQEGYGQQGQGQGQGQGYGHVPDALRSSGPSGAPGHLLPPGTFGSPPFGNSPLPSSNGGSSTTTTPGVQSDPQLRAGPGQMVVVHEDGGRVLMGKGGRAREEEEEEALPADIPPTYDSLPDDVRRTLGREEGQGEQQEGHGQR